MTLELHIRPTPQSAYASMLDGGLEVTELDGFIWVPYESDCWHCGQPTTWIDIDFETALHPGRCSERKWDEYRWAEMHARISSPEWMDEVRSWIARGQD